MSNRRFEMYQYRQVICRMRLGETDRRIAKAGLMGRRKAAELREVAQEQGWLRDGPLPEDSQLAGFFQPKRQINPQISLLLPYKDQVKGWWEKGIQGISTSLATRSVTSAPCRGLPAWRSSTSLLTRSVISVHWRG